MNREERRRKERKNKKENDKKVEAIKWVKSLPPEKAELIENYATIIANDINKKTKDRFIEDVGMYFWAALFEVREELELSDAENIKEVFAKLKEDDEIKGKNLVEKCGGNIRMATKKVNELAPKVEGRVKELILEDKKQKEIVEILAIEFSTLSKAMLINAFKKVKSELKIKQAIKKAEKVNEIVKSLGNPDVNTEEALEYIFEEEKDEFEILNEVRILDIKGKMASYHVENKVVEVDKQLSFTSDLEVKQWAEEEIKALEERINNIKSLETETIKVIKKYL